MKPLVCVFILFSIVLTVVSSDAQDKLVFCTFLRPDTPNIVIAERVLREAYKRLGQPIEVLYLPGARGLQKANAGEADGELFHVEGIDRAYPNLLMVPVPVFSSDLVVLTKDAHFQVTGWDSLKPYTIGVVRGFKLVEDHTQDMQVEPINNQEQLVQKVLLGRTDIAVDTRRTCLYTIKKLNVTGLTILEPPLNAFFSYHYLHKKHRDVLPKLEQVLREMEEEGYIQQAQEEVTRELIQEIR